MHPLLYELNTRCWLRELSAQHRQVIQLGNVPEEEFASWLRQGFTHLWLMGTWTTCTRARETALNDPALIELFRKALPDWTPDDVTGSPYAVAEYRVPDVLGGEEGLRQFRARLNTHGLKLILDFVPNHTGLGHPWVTMQPELFVQSHPGVRETFVTETNSGIAWIAHGKDPFFPGWNDTAQLDYRRADTQAIMQEILRGIAARCDGVRCDMAMLLLRDVFAKTWAAFPKTAPQSPDEFWTEAIASVKRAQPGFLFMAEVYWDLEENLQRLGFDFTYDKWLYDHLAYDNYAETQNHLLDVEPDFLQRSVHFLENHDEQRAATRFTLEEHRVAALLTFGLPGMRFLHEGQLEGARVRLPVHLSRRPVEREDMQIASFYERLLAAIDNTAVGHGEFAVLRPRAAWSENATDHCFVVVQWQSAPDSFDLVVVNLAAQSSQCYVTPAITGLSRREWKMEDLLGEEKYWRNGTEMQASGLYLALPPRGAQLFHFTPAK
ncbi:MAG: alpha-amylase [Verrucomicrobia bacterium]|nr:alpha-amylase [Verrucomicrobiota bacterium]